MPFSHTLDWRKPKRSAEFVMASIIFPFNGIFWQICSKNFDFSMFARLFVRFGVVAVNGVEVGEKATRELCESIAPIQNTFFGDFWTFGTGKEQSMVIFEGIGPIFTICLGCF